MSPAAFAPPRPLTADGVTGSYHALEAALPAAGAPAAEWEAWFWRWNALRVELSGEASRRYFRECQDTRDPAAAAAWKDMREVIYPIGEAGDGKLRAAFLAAGCRAELEGRLGTQLFARMTLDAAGFDPANVARYVEEMDAVSRYDKLMGGAQIPVGDETLTLVQTQARLNDPDAGRRQAAWDAMGRWFDAQGDAIHAILSSLIALRHAQAVQLGDADFTPLAYRRMGRTEYGPAQVRAFREAVKQHIVPLGAAVRERQAADLGTLASHGGVRGADMTYFPNASLGPDAAPVAEQLDRATALFDRLHPTLAAHFRRMREEGLIDLENRPGKKPGAFAMGLDDEDRVAIFCNSTGADADVSILTHEMGHAFQGWESLWIKALDLRTPTMDAAEIHSFGMEYLALHAVDAFFSPEDAARFRRLRLMSPLTRVPYMAMVDEFQHWLYAHPGHDAGAREQVWADLWAVYMPGLAMDDCPRQKQYRWMRQSHIFSTPFYYIDYALAETAALQLWLMAREDHGKAVEAFLALCRVGGTKALLGILGEAGLRSPFEPGALAPLMAALREELGV